jgi:hypothetical protein
MQMRGLECGPAPIMSPWPDTGALAAAEMPLTGGWPFRRRDPRLPKPEYFKSELFEGLRVCNANIAQVATEFGGAANGPPWGSHVGRSVTFGSKEIPIYRTLNKINAFPLRVRWKAATPGPCGRAQFNHSLM